MAGFLDQFQQQNYVSSYMALPIEEITQTAATLDKMYWDNLQNSSDLKAAIASIKTEAIDGHIVKDAATRTSNYLREYADNGNYEDASLAINNAYTSLKTDKRLIAAVATKRSRDAVKDNLDKMYRSGQIDKILYDRRLREFNSYNGVDNLYDKEGDMYHDYNFEYGPNYFDTEAEIVKLASGFNFDKQAHSNSTLEKSKEFVPIGDGKQGVLAGAFGINSAKNTATRSIIEAKDFYKYFKESISQNTAALSYYKEVVDEMNLNRPPDQKITLEGYIEQQALHAKSKYDGIDIATAREEIEDYQDVLNLKRNLAGSGNSTSAIPTIPVDLPFMSHKTDQGFERGNLDIPTFLAKVKDSPDLLDHMGRAIASAGISSGQTAISGNNIKKGSTAFSNGSLEQNFHDALINNLIVASGVPLSNNGTIASRQISNYIEAANNIIQNNLPVSVRANTYANPTDSDSRKKWIAENMMSMTLYDIKTGKVISGKDFMDNNRGDKDKQEEFTLNGIPSVDSPYMLMTGNPAFAASSAVITDKKGNMYVVGGNNHRAEEDPNGYRYDVAYNLITQTRAMQGKINLPITDPTNPNNRSFSARYNKADGSYDIFEITGGKFKPVPLVRTTDAAEAAKYVTTLMDKPMLK